MLRGMSYILNPHEVLDGLAALARMGATTMENYNSAQCWLTEASSPLGCSRFLRAWHHGRALHMSFFELTLTKILPEPAAKKAVALLYGECKEIGCSCHRIVAEWTAGCRHMVNGERRCAWDGAAYTFQQFKEWYGDKPSLLSSMWCTKTVFRSARCSPAHKTVGKLRTCKISCELSRTEGLHFDPSSLDAAATMRTQRLCMAGWLWLGVFQPL